MSEMYNAESIKVAWENDISRYKTIVKAWESVTFPTKKDGTPFKAMGKNINGAKYVHSDDSLSAYGMKVSVTTDVP